MLYDANASREYRIGTWVSLAVYAAAILALSWAGDAGYLKGPALWAASLIPGACIAAQLWLVLRLMGHVDEFVRAVMAKRFIAAAAFAMVVATVWGFQETYSHAYHLPGWLIYPLFWIGYGLASPFLRSST